MPSVKLATDIRRMTEFGVGTYIRTWICVFPDFLKLKQFLVAVVLIVVLVLLITERRRSK
ncbi:hypothetical protein SBA1_90116 [Candidatus Sulfotelmatobacter kueseliae]|uniref:Uncharacterized protein n=1 Tax=Candidatus Sulfotelmatobacter kueseliae TaxID=2042962 RepID=A0A2U3LAR7_9BACT|nr:hypothetical protein SBA1_90116 [Candidatus Sulfotelmatobacter kueseliae]